VTPPELVNLSPACLTGEGIVPVGIDTAVAALTARRPRHADCCGNRQRRRRGACLAGASKSVLSVGAQEGPVPAAYSNIGYWVDFCVRADGIVSTYVSGVRQVDSPGFRSAERIDYDGQYMALSGTSFAAPQVAGLLAVLRSEGLSASRAVAELKWQSVTPRKELTSAR
jgi:subtilisin family serine protease